VFLWKKFFLSDYQLFSTLSKLGGNKLKRSGNGNSCDAMVYEAGLGLILRGKWKARLFMS
jgi:hypothetical protein